MSLVVRSRLIVGPLLEELRLPLVPALETLEFRRFDGHFFNDEGECFSCRERGTRTLRSSGIRWSLWCALGAVLKVWRGSMSPAPPRSTNGSGRRLSMVATTQAARPAKNVTNCASFGAR